MKKLFVSIVAVAAMAFTFTSCNKEENATGKNLNIPFEENEIMNDFKAHLENDNVMWDVNDRFIIMDNDCNTATYLMLSENGNAYDRQFVRNEFGTFDATSSQLWAFYPTSIMYKRTKNEIRLPSIQESQAGEAKDYPMYAQGAPSDPTFTWRNTCGIERLTLTGDVAIDSISITTDRNLNGHFRVNINDLDNMLAYGSSSRNTPAYGHGTKTNTLVFGTRLGTSFHPAPLQLTSTPQEVNIYVPAGDYQKFHITFYSNGQRLVVRNTGLWNIDRTHFYTDPINIQSSRFVDFEEGTLTGTFKINSTESVQFAQGNLEYIAKAGSSSATYWYLQDNQWDYVGKEQNGRSNAFDRDLFAWGATGRNGVPIWGVGNEYKYYQGGNTLTGTSDWGCLPIRNGGNSEWRTLTASEMSYILNNHQNAIVTLGFVGVTGLLICPEGFTGTCPAANTVITKAQWNQLEKAGCVFFAINNYRKNTGNFDTRISTTGTTSYFWLNTSDDATTAYALKVDANGAQIVNNLHRQIGACVRLAKVVSE